MDKLDLTSTSSTAVRLQPRNFLQITDPFHEPDEALYEKACGYFDSCEASGVKPRFTGLALHLGFDSVAQMVNDAQRKPRWMRLISRSILAIADVYEEQLVSGNFQAGAFILQRLPSFDSREPVSAGPVFFMRDRQEVSVSVSGVEKPEDRGNMLTPREAYLKLIRSRVIEEESAAEESDTSYVEIKVDENNPA